MDKRVKLKCSSVLRWNSHCGPGRKTILNCGIYIVLWFLYHNHDYEEVLYLLKFNTLDYSTFDLMAYKKILSNAVKCNLSLDNNGLDAHIVTPEAEESFDDRDFEPNEEFNVYLVARRYSIDEASLNDLIKETAEQILNYTDFEEEHYW